jgi:hypothetical protein
VFTSHIQNGQTERIEVLALDAAGNPITGLSDVLLTIRRISDDYYLDFNDNTFKASGWTTRQKVMTELDATNDAGIYYYDFDTSGFSDDTYQLRASSATATNDPWAGELRVGGYINRLLGLSLENIYRHTRTYSGGKLVSEKLDMYNNKANAQTHDGSTGIVAKYTATMTYADNNLDTVQMVRDS